MLKPTQRSGSARASHFSRLLAITVLTEVFNGWTTGLWGRRGHAHNQIRWNVVIILGAVWKIFWTRCHMCLHVCLVWPPNWKQLLVIQNPLAALIPKMGFISICWRKCFVFVLRHTDKMSATCFCAICIVFQDHLKILGTDLIFVILVHILVLIIAPISNWFHCLIR